MKCGKETAGDQVFCSSCLEVMKQFPVKPDAYVQLPNRPAPAAKKASPRKKALSPEEQVLRLRKSVRTLAIALTCAVLALALSVALLVHTVQRQDSGSSNIGQNYNTVDNTGNFT